MKRNYQIIPKELNISTKPILSDNIYFVYVFSLKTRKAVGLVFSFRMSLPKQFGARHLTGMKTYLVWPLIFILGKENMPILWPLGSCQSAGPSSHRGLPSSFHSSPVFTGYRRKHLLFTPPLCGFLLAPRCCDAGNHRLHILPSLFLEVPSSFLGSASLL